jgi:hypothetical protein
MAHQYAGGMLCAADVAPLNSAENASFAMPFLQLCNKTTILPRQARDKHGKALKTVTRFP